MIVALPAGALEGGGREEGAGRRRIELASTLGRTSRTMVMAMEAMEAEMVVAVESMAAEASTEEVAAAEEGVTTEEETKETAVLVPPQREL